MLIHIRRISFLNKKCGYSSCDNGKGFCRYTFHGRKKHEIHSFYQAWDLLLKKK